MRLTLCESDLANVKETIPMLFSRLILTLPLLLGTFVLASCGEEETPPPPRGEVRPVSPGVPLAEAVSLPQSEAKSYEVVSQYHTSGEDGGVIHVWIFAPEAESRAQRAETVLRAALEALDNQGSETDAIRSHIHLIPSRSESLVGSEWVLSEGHFDEGGGLGNGQWEVRAAEGEISEDDLLVLEFLTSNANRVASPDGEVEEDTLVTYVARVFDSLPSEIRQSMENARGVTGAKTSYP